LGESEAFVEVDPSGLELLKYSKNRLEVHTIIDGINITVGWAVYGYTLLKIGTVNLSGNTFDHHLYFSDFYPEREIEEYFFIDLNQSLNVRKCTGGLEARFRVDRDWQFLISDIQIKVLQKQTSGLANLMEELDEEIEELYKKETEET